MENDVSEELIHRQMQETRAALTEKLETLENKVVGTVADATNAVSETVEAIKETVHDTVASVNETVKESVETVKGTVKDSVDSVKDFFDLPAHVDQHPWLMVGGCVAVGYCLGTLIAPKPAQVSHYSSSPVPERFQSNAPASTARTSEPAPKEQSFWAPEIAKIKGLALGVLFGTARELLLSSVPEHIADQLKEVVDNVTKKAGGDPLPSSDWDALRQPTPAVVGATTSPQTANDADNGHSAAAGNRRW